MDKRIYFLSAFVLASCLLFSGCAGTKGENNAASTANFRDVAYPFTDVPIPAGFKADRSKSFIYESGGGSVKVGRMYYSGWNGLQELVSYYQNAMINKGWKMVNAMEHDGMILNYEKKGWICTLIVTESVLKTHLEIQIGPK